MAASLNGLDYAIILTIGLGALRGLGRGAIRMATSILSLALGLYAAASWYLPVVARVQKALGTSPPVSRALGYAIVFLVVLLAIEYVGRRIIMLVNLVDLGFLDRLAGGVFGAGIAAAIAGLAIVAMTAYMAPNPPIITDSRFAPTVLAYNEALLSYVPPEVKKEYVAKRDELYRYWLANRKPTDQSPPPANQ